MPKFPPLIWQDMGDTSWQCRCGDTQKFGVFLFINRHRDLCCGDVGHRSGDLWHHCAEVVDMSFGTTRHLCHYKVLDFGRLADVRSHYVFGGIGFLRLLISGVPLEILKFLGAETISLYHPMGRQPACLVTGLTFLKDETNVWECTIRWRFRISNFFRNRNSLSHFSKRYRGVGGDQLKQ